jgi:hypothetical protein
MQNYPLTESPLDDLAAQVDARVQRLEELRATLVIGGLSWQAHLWKSKGHGKRF